MPASCRGSLSTTTAFAGTASRELWTLLALQIVTAMSARPAPRLRYLGLAAVVSSANVRGLHMISRARHRFPPALYRQHPRFARYAHQRGVHPINAALPAKVPCSGCHPQVQYDNAMRRCWYIHRGRGQYGLPGTRPPTLQPHISNAAAP
jgi:hypothetical protein